MKKIIFTISFALFAILSNAQTAAPAAKEMPKQEQAEVQQVNPDGTLMAEPAAVQPAAVNISIRAEETGSVKQAPATNDNTRAVKPAGKTAAPAAVEPKH